jgi:hypothetical protein
MTQREQNIYNTYLRLSRTLRGQPWRPRQDFEGFDDTKEGFYVKRLDLFFTKFPSIIMEEFFTAPFELYKDEKYFGLDFFITQKAINAYAVYHRQKEGESPDSPDQLKFLLDSLKFIGSYCKENGILLSEYIHHKIEISYAFAVHYKQKKVSIYSLIFFPSFEKNVYQLEPDERDLFFNSENPDFSKFKTRFLTSSKARNIATIGYNRLENFLKNPVSSS